MNHVMALLLLASAGLGEVPGPPPAAKYRAVVRYRILPPRDTHVALYDAMTEHLAGIGFEFDPPLEKHPKTDREDPTKDQIAGFIAGKNAARILENRSVASVQLVPVDFKLPDQPEQHVHVRLDLAGGIPPDRQRELGDQVRLIIGLLGFKEAYGYDHHGHTGKPFTRIVGAIPAGNLDLLLRDIRTQPTGWLTPLFAPTELPSPLKQMNPIVISEVLPDPEPLKEVELPARASLVAEKIGPELWALTEKKELHGRVVRLQVVMVGNPAPEDKSLRWELNHAAPSLDIEGWLGQVITGTAEIGHVTRLATLPEVSSVRLLRTVKVDVDPKIAAPADNAKALEASGLAALHQRGFRGKGVRLVLVDTDFRGWEKMVAEKKLPSKTQLIDMTAERDPGLWPLPYPEGDVLGHGTQCAMAAVLAAPEVSLTLVRIEGTDPYQLYEMVKFFQGSYLTESMKRRQDELIADRFVWTNRREALLKERAKILDDFTDESELERDFGFLGPVMGWIFSDRQLMYQKMRYQERNEKLVYERYARFQAMTERTDSLKGAFLVACPLAWQAGLPAGSASALSRYLHQGPKGLLWFQAAGNTRGQAWSGFYRDDDGNGVLEFSQDKPAKERWSSELNFLGWRPHEGEAKEELPLQGKVRLTMQWREPHDRAYFIRNGEDPYLEPLADLQLHVLRQRDPELKTLPADAFELVARSSRLPARLEHQPSHSIYEHSVEFTVDKPSRFAVRVERQLPTRWVLREEAKRPGFALLESLVPTGMRPRGVPTLTALEKNWELRLRVFVEVVDDATRPQGRVVLADHATGQGSMGLPADSRGVISVGAVDADGKPFASSASGPPAFQDLGTRPDLLAYASLQVAPEGNTSAYGTSLSSAFAAGWAASLLGSGMSRDQVMEAVRRQAGQVLRVPGKK